jgi:MFS family permease
VPAAIAAALAAILTIGGGAIAIAVGNPPSDDKTTQLLFVHEHGSALIAGAAVSGLGAIAIALALLYLLEAARARRPETPAAARVAALAGGIGACVVGTAARVILVHRADQFAASGDQTYEQAKRALEGGAFQAVQVVGILVQLLLAIAFVLVSLNAMRAGLVTRFMGYVGMIAGALFILPLSGPLPVIQTFWLLALVPLFLGRWPSGQPPAWITGQAQPWPSAQKQREARERADEGSEERAAPAPAKAAAPDDTADDDAADSALGRPHPSSKKRKRKRRR